MTRDPICHVYFIAPIGGGLVKIGSSRKVGERLEQLAAWSPVHLEILAAVPGNLYDEYAVQTVFIGDRSHKEWFHPSPALFALIDELKVTGKLPAKFRGKQASGPCKGDGTKDPKPRKPRSRESIELGAAAIREYWKDVREGRIKPFKRVA